MLSREAASAAKFPTTQWTQLLSLRQNEGPAREKVLQQLCHSYWFPLYAYARHRGLQRHDAEDAVQSLFLATGDTDFFEKADQEKGKFRTFLLTAFTRLLSSRTTYNNAQKRGGGAVHLSIDADQAEAWLLADPAQSPEDAALAFERHWAKNIIRSVLTNLEAEAKLNPKSAARFHVLSRFLMPESCLDYSIRQAAGDLDIHLATCEKAIQRLRTQFRQAVRKEVASTLNQPNEESITEEMIQLQKALLAG